MGRISREQLGRLSLPERHDVLVAHLRRRDLLRSAGVVTAAAALTPSLSPALWTRAAGALSSAAVPVTGRWLSYGNDPRTEMTVSWQVPEPVDRPQVRFGPAGALDTVVPAELRRVLAGASRGGGLTADGVVGNSPGGALGRSSAGQGSCCSAIAGPGTGGSRQGGGQRQLAPASGREGEAVTAQRDGFHGVQCRVIQAAEERGQFGPNSADLFQDGVNLPGARDNPGIGRAGGSRGRRWNWPSGLTSSSPSSTA